MHSQPTVTDVLTTYVQARRKLRSIGAQEAAFARHVLPTLGTLPVAGLRRSQVATALDTVVERAGPAMANRTLAYLRAALNWHALRYRRLAVPACARDDPRVA